MSGQVNCEDLSTLNNYILLINLLNGPKTEFQTKVHEQTNKLVNDMYKQCIKKNTHK